MKIVIASCAVAVLVVGCASHPKAASIADHSTASTNSAGSATSTSPTGLATTPADTVDSLGHSKFPRTYAGERLLADNETQIEVELTALDPAVETAFKNAVGSSTNLQFRLVANSAADLVRLRQRMEKSLRTLRHEGVDVVSYGDAGDGRLHIGVLTRTNAAVRRLDALLGKANIVIEAQSPVTPSAP